MSFLLFLHQPPTCLLSALSDIVPSKIENTYVHTLAHMHARTGARTHIYTSALARQTSDPVTDSHYAVMRVWTTVIDTQTGR